MRKKDTSASSTSISARRSERIFLMIQGVVHAPSSFTLQPDLDYQLAFLLLESNLYVLIHGILYGTSEFTHVSARASID